MLHYFIKLIEQGRVPAPLRKPLVAVLLIYHDMNRSDLFRHASGMAYVTLLSIVPSLAATFALISLFKPLLGHDNALVQKGKDFVLQHLASGSGEQVVSYLESFLQNLDLTQIGVTGLAGLLVSLVLLLKQIELALNRIWEVEQPRNLIRRFVYFWTFLTLGALVIGLSIGIWSRVKLQALLPVGGSLIESYTPGLVAAVTPLASTLIFFFLLFKAVPNCNVHWKPAAIGAAFATVLFSGGSDLYAYYVSHLASYRAIYGAFAALPLFLLWLYISWIIILLGSVVNRRFQMGIAIGDLIALHKADDLTLLERLRRAHLQAILPLWSLLFVYHAFDKGERRGTTAQDVSHTLRLPLEWVQDALLQLVDLGFAVVAGERDEDGTENRFFPSSSESQFKMSDFVRQNFEPSLSWLEGIRPHLPIDLFKATERLYKTPRDALQHLTLEDLRKGLTS